MALHYSGCLLEWMEEKRPDLVDRIAALSQKGAVEILGGGFYEPILSALPERDALGQLEYLNRYSLWRFGHRPCGMWMPERVWEPSMPRYLHKAGIRYTLLDDTHFFYTGLNQDDIFGYYVTEREGCPLAIFPIDKKLRYLIPFAPDPEEVIDHLRSLAESHPDMAVTYGDDGEKFGIWPGTHEHVFTRGWLEKFFKLIEQNRRWLIMMSPGEYLQHFSPTGRIYLPTASYEEMAEWALPAKAIHHYDDLVKTVQSMDHGENFLPFVRGGIWENFLVKYPESNQMHKKMLFVSQLLADLGIALEPDTDKKTPPSIHPALQDLWRAQCNCAYWHGLFGGVYLNYLRHAVYHHLCRAELTAEQSKNAEGGWMECTVKDMDIDGFAEIRVSTEPLTIYLGPACGGSIFELDYKPLGFNLANTMTRREEAYHQKLRQATAASAPKDEIPTTIHNLEKPVVERLEEVLQYDWYPRHSFLDHFLAAGSRLEHFRRCQYEELGDFVNQPYNLAGPIQQRGDRIGFVLRRHGGNWMNGRRYPFIVSKRFTFSRHEALICADYTLEMKKRPPVPFHFGVEFNLTLLAGDAPDRYYQIPGVSQSESRLNSIGESCQIDNISMVDRYNGIQVQLKTSRPANLWRFPLETASQSEQIYEKQYQGSVLLLWWPELPINDNSARLTITLEIEEIG